MKNISLTLYLSAVFAIALLVTARGENIPDLYLHDGQLLNGEFSPWILVDFRSPKLTPSGILDGFNRKGLISSDGVKKKAFVQHSICD